MHSSSTLSRPAAGALHARTPQRPMTPELRTGASPSPAGVAGRGAAQACPLHADCFLCRVRQGWVQADRFRSLSFQHTLAPGRRVVARGTPLYQVGEPLHNLYAIHAGQFKTSTTAPSGRMQVTGFHVPGELLGLDGIATGEHACDALALEDAQVCVIPYAELGQMLLAQPALQREFLQIMGNQLVRDRDVMLWLGSLKAEERVANFLLNLLDRLALLGFSSTALVLRMTREEIGSYLGLTLETVSRSFSHFRQLGLLDVKERDIRIPDRARLLRMSTGH